MARRQVRAALGSAALKGALAGMAGAMVMKAVMEMEQRALLPEGQRMEPPPKKLVAEVAESRGVELTPGQEQAAAMGVHLGYSALWGALHGVGSHLLRLPTALHGMLLGGAVYAATVGPGGLLPRMGVLPSPMLQPLRKAAVPLGAHAAFGLTTAAVYDALS